jgi:urease accessory protein
LSLMMSHGAGFCDAVLFAHTHRAVANDDAPALRVIAELAAAFSPSKERHLETTAQGRAFVVAVRAAWPCDAIEMLDAAWDGPIAYPVAVGTACAGHGIAAETALPAFLHAVAANWISAGVRLIPLGQTDGQRVLAAIEGVIAATAERALNASLDDIGGAAFRADLASMRHETQYTRLFRS